MNTVNDMTDQMVVECLKAGGVVVARTDTLYGVLARADDEQAVARVYALKDRSAHKSPIVLIASEAQLYDDPPDAAQRLMRENWPGPVSIIVPSRQAPLWLRRDNDSVAYRLPRHEKLVELIRRTGPLIAPSANIEARQPASSIDDAYAYFGDRVDIYVDDGVVEDGVASRLLRVGAEGEVEQLR